MAQNLNIKINIKQIGIKIFDDILDKIQEVGKALSATDFSTLGNLNEIGKNLQEEPSIPNFGKPGKGPRIKNGMVFAVEPMINIGTYMVDVDANDNWTVYTRDRKNSAHFEHTLAIVDGSAKILTRGENFN